MNPSFSLLCIAVALACQSVNAADFKAWQYQQTVPVITKGVARLDLPVETLGASRSKLEDLRLLSPLGVEAPFSIQRAELTPVRVMAAKTFQLQLADQKTVIEIETGTPLPLTALLLDSPATSFIKAVAVEGSNDGQTWNPLTASQMIFRQPTGASRLRIPLPSTPWSRLRVTVDDHRDPPVPFTTARLELETPQPPLVTQSLTKFSSQQRPRETQLDVALGANHLQIATVKLLVADPVFIRRYRLSYFPEERSRPEVTLGAGVIYRVMADNRTEAALEIPIHRQIDASHLVLIVYNGDSPALKVTSMEITRVPVSMVFFAHMPGDWQLVTSHRSVAAPDYDLQSLQQQLGKLPATTLSPGPLQTNPGYQEPQALPDVIPEGASLDTSPWHYRKPVADAAPGVLRVPLDLDVLAHAQTSLGDLRLIQNGRQVPFLTERSNTLQSLDTHLELAPDPEQPSVSIWRATLPLAGLPAERIVCSSPTPMFERTMEFLNRGTDNKAGAYHVDVRSGPWVRHAGDAKEEFPMPSMFYRLQKEFLIRTENNDNTAITLDKVRVEYRGAEVIAKLSRSGPVFLYYGNEEVGAPRYDLLLARQELLAAPMKTLALGPEEKLRAEPARPASFGAGSPWLWAALGLVLVVLLWVVAKMLPVAGAPPE